MNDKLYLIAHCPPVPEWFMPEEFIPKEFAIPKKYYDDFSSFLQTGECPENLKKKFNFYKEEYEKVRKLNDRARQEFLFNRMILWAEKWSNEIYEKYSIQLR